MDLVDFGGGFGGWGGGVGGLGGTGTGLGALELIPTAIICTTMAWAGTCPFIRASDKHGRSDRRRSEQFGRFSLGERLVGWRHPLLIHCRLDRKAIMMRRLIELFFLMLVIPTASFFILMLVIPTMRNWRRRSAGSEKLGPDQNTRQATAPGIRRRHGLGQQPCAHHEGAQRQSRRRPFHGLRLHQLHPQLSVVQERLEATSRTKASS